MCFGAVPVFTILKMLCFFVIPMATLTSTSARREFVATPASCLASTSTPTPSLASASTNASTHSASASSSSPVFYILFINVCFSP